MTSIPTSSANRNIEDQRAVLITGGSLGLGRALGKTFAERGLSVLLVARNRERLERAVQDLRKQTENARVYALPYDVGEKQDVHRLLGHAFSLVGAIDIVVHNASTLGPVPMPGLAELNCEDFSAVLETNLLGPFRMNKALAPAMALRGTGTFVHISSDAAVEAYPNWGAYGISKAALDHLSRSFAAEFPALRFLSFDPGEMNTAMHHDAMPDADPNALRAPEDVAECLVRLLLESSIASGTRMQVAVGSSAQVQHV